MDLHERENELIRKASAGEEAAFERLMLMHHSRLMAELGRKLPANVSGFVAVEDVLQETYVVVFREIAKFQSRGPGSFHGWLARIAENRLFDAIKAERAAKRGGGRAKAEPPTNAESDPIVEWLSALYSHQRTPSKSVAGRETFALVEKALAGLKDDYREALRLRYVEGLSVAEAAARMQRTAGALTLLCHRGLRRMREALGSSAQFFASRE